MTSYEITLPSKVQAPKLSSENAFINSKNMKMALLSFDSNGDKQLDKNELLNAYKYFVQKEKEIAISGKKGDGKINDKDVEYFLSNDNNFKYIRDLNITNEKKVNLLGDIIKTLSALVSVDLVEGATIFEVFTDGFKTMKKHDTKGYNVFRYATSNQLVKNVQYTEKTINGKKIRLCTNEKGENYVTTPSGNRYTNADVVAQYLGYNTKSTWIGLGKNEYYTEHTEYEKGYYYKNVTEQEWDEEKHSFVAGETKTYTDFTFIQRFLGLNSTPNNKNEHIK